jgi:glucose-1-phosphate cytidylyltransferase
MKVAILAGGLGTRLSEETTVKPKPMVEVGGHPILWHIMKIYAHHGYNEFVLALGYKGDVIKDYFLNYQRHSRDLTIDLRSGEVTVHDGSSEEWVVHLLDTGLETSTGGRVKKVAEYIRDETFMLTYGDGVCDVNVHRLLDFHQAHGKLATVTAVRPPGRFGSLGLDGDRVTHFAEKPQVGEGWINGGFFVLEPQIADYIPSYQMPWEAAPLERLAAEGQLSAYRHDSFWMCMDTLRDVKLLETLWQEGKAPWKVW